ncbi:UNVERIFIED_CONTAM: hypothetical protein Scaly_1785900 [Sesamum calycinum]|uniref:Reverse transcriptase domain-containing protein n=1 Tax=Sesamum calycinum TaxID=2727403 RepID=A0AAW2NVT5_9LAMI
MWFRDYSCEALVADTWLFFVADCVAEHMTCLISKIENQELCMIPSSDEIRNIVFGMSAYKSPGPDGFLPSFFKQYWHIVGENVIEATTYFFSTGVPPAATHTSRSSPKTQKPISLNSSDPSICEIIHYLHTKKGNKGYMAIKIDLSKAYDRVEWSFLLRLLEAVGFNETFVNWISQCVSSISFSLLINGAAFDFFKSSRGIRQGDPLSPFFIIYAEFLSRIIMHEESLGNLKGIKGRGKGCRNYPAMLADQFHDVMHVAEQPLWNDSTQSQLGVVFELVDIKVQANQEAHPDCKKDPIAIPGRLPSLVERSHVMLDWVCARMSLHRTDSTVARILFEPLIEELQNLWHVGVLTRESAKNKTFTMRAMLMWTVNDLPIYGMAYGWTTSVIGCPELRLHDMKSHDCHVFMQKLIPIAFCEILPESVWSMLTEILCKWNRPHRNDDLTMNDTRIQQSLFKYPGRASGVSKKRCLSGSERHLIVTYILTNYEVVTLYYESSLKELYEHHHSKDPIIEELVATQFKDWFKRCVKFD